MKDPLVRFGVAIEGTLLRQLDALAGERGCTRSELLRDLARAEVGRAKVPKGVGAVGALTLVYDHHVRDLSERLTSLQHEMGDSVRAALHVHLSHELCLEIVVMRGRSDRLQGTANRILAMRGVKQGGIEIIPDPQKNHAEAHDHSHPGHAHVHEGDGEGTPASSSPSGRGRGDGARRAARRRT